MDSDIEYLIRKLKLDMLSFLYILASTKAVALDVDEISRSIKNNQNADLRGIIGTLRRLRIDNQTFIIPAGRDSKGRLRWQINESLVSKNELSKLIEKILDKNLIVKPGV